MDGVDSGAPSPVSLRHLREAGDDFPALVCDRYLTVIAANEFARAVSPAFAPGTNLARAVFLDRERRRPTRPCEALEDQLAAMLRESVSHHHTDSRFRRLVGELCALSRRFARSWATPVEIAETGEAQFDNRLVGPLTLTYRKLRPNIGYDDSVFVLTPADGPSREAAARLRATLPDVH